jgi:hypothetical protein
VPLSGILTARIIFLGQEASKRQLAINYSEKAGYKAKEKLILGNALFEKPTLGVTHPRKR